MVEKDQPSQGKVEAPSRLVRFRNRYCSALCANLVWIALSFLNFLRMRIVGFLIIIAMIALAFDVEQVRVNHKFKVNDYHACLRSKLLVKQAARNFVQVEGTRIVFPEDCRKYKP